MRTIESCLTNGYPLLLENIEYDIDPYLEPLLAKSYYKKGAQNFIKIGGQELSYNTDFVLYLTTKLDNPHYLPDLLMNVNLKFYASLYFAFNF